MHLHACLGAFRRSAGGLRMPWISQNLQGWKKERKQTSSFWCWCAVNLCHLPKPQKPTPLLPFPRSRKSDMSLVMLRVAAPQQRCRARQAQAGWLQSGKNNKKITQAKGEDKTYIIPNQNTWSKLSALLDTQNQQPWNTKHEKKTMCTTYQLS